MDTRRARIYNGSKKVDAIYKGSSATPMYTWEEKEVMVGMPERIPYTTENSYDSSLLKWESHTVPGRDGYREYYGNVDVINGKQVGSATDVYPEISTPPKPQTNVVGTKQLDESYEKSNTVSLGGYTATAEHPVRKRVSFLDYKWPINTEAVVTYRVSGGGVNNSNTSGQVRYKHIGANSISFKNFTAIIDETDVDSLGNPLCVVIDTMTTTSGTTHYGEYIDLFFEQNISDIYDINVYLENGESTLVNIVGAPIQSGSFISNGQTFYQYYQPWTQVIDPEKEYIVKTESPHSSNVTVHLYDLRDDGTGVWSASIGTIPANSTEGIKLMGSELLKHPLYPDGIATSYGVSNPNRQNSNLTLEVWGYY